MFISGTLGVMVLFCIIRTDVAYAGKKNCSMKSLDSLVFLRFWTDK